MSRIVGHFWDEYLQGGDLNDQIYAKGGDDEVYGGNGNDRVFGDAGDDVLYGQGGRDRVGGGAGNDGIWDNEGDYNILDGGKGNDWVGGVGDLYGHGGDDTLYADHGGELQGTTMTGGTGHDVFGITMDAAPGSTYDPYNGVTALGAAQRFVIKDFHSGSDHLQLAASDPLGNWADSNDYGYGPSILSVFDSNYDGALTKDDTYVSPTADGDGIELDFWNIRLAIDHVQSITAQDFML